jgi:hypothetical protein
VASSHIPTGISDLYSAWAQVGGSIDFEASQLGKQATFLVLFEIKINSNTASTAEGNLAELKREFEQYNLPIQPHPPWWNKQAVYGTATVTAGGLAHFHKLAQAGFIHRFEVSLIPRQARASHQHGLPKLSNGTNKLVPCKSPVLFGLIDHGCPFAHPCLKTQAGTSRLLNVWYQEENTNLFAIQSPLDWGFGASVTCEQIDDVLNVARFKGVEDAFIYAQLGLPELQRNASHGAHMLGNLLDATSSPSLLWDGFKDSAPPYKPRELPNSPDVVFVQLPDVYLQNLTRCAIAPYRLSALRYILDSAGPKTAKVFVPISSEDFVGSHDGTTLFEMALDAMVEFAYVALDKKELRVLISASNSLRLRSHASPGQTAVKEAKFQARIYPANELPTFMEIWLRTGRASKGVHSIGDLSIAIKQKSQSAAQATTLPINSGQVFANTAGKMFAGVVSMALQGQQVLLVRLPPSFTYDDHVATLPSDDWEISITSKSKKFEAHAYIARSFQGLGGSLRSHQSQFIEPRRPNANADTLSAADDLLEEYPDYGAGSINGIANGQHVLVIGGYRLWDQRRSPYSGAAPARPNGRLDISKSDYPVDFAAPSDESPSLRGIRSWGNRSGGSVRLDGASVATPFAARSAAKGQTPMPPLRSSSKVAAPKQKTPPASTKKSRADPKIPPKNIFIVIPDI